MRVKQRGMDAGSVDAEDGLPTKIPTEIDGQPCHEEKHKHNGDIGIRVVCGVHGPQCRKFRTLRRDVDRLGPNAATYFLGAWLAKAKTHTLTLKQHTHKSNNPTVGEIKAYIASL